MTEKITVFDPVDYLDSWEMVEAFLADAHETGDAAWIAEAMAIVERTKIRTDEAEEAQVRSNDIVM
jgi:DNA-binding phage protein